ncbi:MAG: hypothetical protein QNJ97_14865 [Myxococcota bacterium]|nr:hypothetical protein [Myxococcota bacterium]
MANIPIDRNKLREHIRKLPGESLLVFLDRSIDMLPDSKLPRLVKDYIRPSDLRPDQTLDKRLLDTVKAFHKASLKRKYYEDFQVNSRNFMQKSRGTQSWIAECRRLLELCVSSARKQHADERQAFELIFDLLHELDRRPYDIIFFADEAGSWQVGVNWDKVLPAYFRCLARTAEPDEYARAVANIVDEHVHYDRNKYMKKARTIASSAQMRALQQIPSSRRG